ncbi:MAG TPA: response regulator transcription factor, partial [Burkholderiales bacterium]|nr:response regulator transcription factor [Burkholderiales bacterium]
GRVTHVTIRILIADDHGVVAEGLRHLVSAQPEMQVIGLAENGRDAVRAALDMRPDIILMDHAMPLLNGTEATRLIHERSPQIRVIMLSMYSDAVHVYRALQAGATGYILKKSVAKEVVDAIQAVHRGSRYLSRQLADVVIDHVVHRSAPQDPLDRLSSRERQVLQLLAEGHSVAEIAATLSLSPKTVETYRARMMEKLGIFELAGLVRFAIQQGVTTLE